MDEPLTEEEMAELGYRSTPRGWIPLKPVAESDGELLSLNGQGNGPTIRASDVTPEKVEWLWDGYVPIGMTTVLGGFPGVGKSTILYDLAARFQRMVCPFSS